MSAVETLAAFLAARYDEAEHQATDEDHDLHLNWCAWGDLDLPAPCDCGNPARRLADIKLKRAILAEHPHQRVDHNWTGRHDLDGPFGCATCHIGISGDVYEGGWCATVRQLGTEFAEHPAYRTEWRPE